MTAPHENYNTDTPTWTISVQGVRPPRAMYPLGIDATTQALEQKLFDGITSQTPHVKYYAFYAWALTRYRESAAATQVTLPPAEFSRQERRWVARLEAVLRAATMLRAPAITGMFGKNAAMNDALLTTTTSLNVPTAAPYRTTGVNFHLGPLMALGCGGRREGHRGEFRAGRGAKALADAIEAACRQQRGGAKALEQVKRAAKSTAKKLDGAVVIPLAPVLGLGPVARDSALHKPLVDLLFAHDGPTAAKRGSSGWARGQALALCLDIAEQANGAVEGSPIQIVRRVVLTGYLDRSHRYQVDPTYKRTLSALRRLYERHTLQLALYGLWRETVVALAGPPTRSLSLESICSRMAANVEAGARETVTRRWLGDSPLTGTVDQLLERIAAERKRRRKRPWASGREELALAIAAGRSADAGSVAAPSVALLLNVAADWLNRTEGGVRVPAFGKWHNEGGRERLALSVVCADVDARRAMNGRTFLSWVMSSYIVGQTLRATVAKGPQTRSGEYLYFIVPDSGGYQLNHPSSLRNYLQVDSPRLRYALGMLEELELIQTGGFNTTKEGRQLLNRLRKVHASAPVAVNA